QSPPRPTTPLKTGIQPPMRRIRHRMSPVWRTTVQQEPEDRRLDRRSSPARRRGILPLHAHQPPTRTKKHKLHMGRIRTKNQHRTKRRPRQLHPPHNNLHQHTIQQQDPQLQTRPTRRPRNSPSPTRIAEAHRRETRTLQAERGPRTGHPASQGRKPVSQRERALAGHQDRPVKGRTDNRNRCPARGDDRNRTPALPSNYLLGDSEEHPNQPEDQLETSRSDDSRTGSRNTTHETAIPQSFSRETPRTAGRDPE